MPPKQGTDALLEWCKMVQHLCFNSFHLAMFAPFVDACKLTNISQRTKGYEGVNITNFHTSWRDGLGFAALLHYFHPDEIEWDKLKAMDDPVKRLEIVFDIGDDLGVANILDAEDMMIEPRPDHFSVITYLSQ